MTANTKQQIDLTENDSRHMGWENYETWAVALWLSNERSSYVYWRRQAETSIQNAPHVHQVKAGIWTESQAACYRLADQLCEAIQSASPIEEPTLYSDLLAAAFGEVDWHEIAQSLICEVEEDREEDREEDS